jgi:hypothetical protein
MKYFECGTWGIFGFETTIYMGGFEKIAMGIIVPVLVTCVLRNFADFYGRKIF